MSSQNAPTSGDNTIRLKYVVDTSAVAPAAAQAGREVERAAEKAAEKTEESLGRTTTALRSTVTQAGGAMQNALQGLEPAMQTVTNGLSRMGAQGAAQIGSLTGSLAKLALMGASPLALAVAGVSALGVAISGFSDEAKDSVDAIDRQADALTRLVEAAQTSRAELEKFRLSQRASLAGNTVAMQGLSEDYDTNEEKLRLTREAMSGLPDGARREELSKKLGELEVSRNLLADQIRDLQARINVQARNAEPDPKLLRDREESFQRFMGRNPLSFPDEHRGSSALFDTMDANGFRLGTGAGESRRSTTNAAIDRLMGDPGAAMQGTFDAQLEEWAKNPAGSPLKARQTETLAYEQSLTEALSKRKDLELQLRSIESGVGEERLRLLDEITEKEKALAALKASGDPLADAEIVARGLELEQLREQLRLRQSIDAAAGRAAVTTKGTEFDRAVSAGTRRAVSDGIAEALTDPSNYKSALQSFASAMQSSITRALADSITDALLGKSSTSGGASILGGLFGAITGGGKDGGSGGGNGPNVQPGGSTTPIGVDAKRSMGERPIVVINSFSERDADAMAQKMSASGAQVVVSRANGEGISRGVVPSRRRG